MLRPEPWALAGGKGQASGDTKQGGIGPGHCAGYREAHDGELWADSAAQCSACRWPSQAGNDP
jgi:hypothetical protein